jgi:hypothetical protein
LSVILLVPWLVGVISPISASIFMSLSLCVCVCVCVCVSGSKFLFSHLNNSNIGFRAQPNSVWPYLNWLHLQGPYFQVSPHSQVLTCILGGHYLTSTIGKTWNECFGKYKGKSDFLLKTYANNNILFFFSCKPYWNKRE